MKTEYAGIDYSGFSGANRNKETGIRFGVIPHHHVGQAWYDESEPDYGNPEEFQCPDCGELSRIEPKEPAVEWGDSVECPHCGEKNECELPDMAEPLAFKVQTETEVLRQSGDNADIFILKSPFYTYAQFCSPCAPGACYLLNWLESPVENNKCYCLGHDWFESGRAPYPVYSVETGKLVPIQGAA